MFFLYKLFCDDNLNHCVNYLEIKKDFKGVYTGAYNIVETMVKSNDKTPFHRKILVFSW